MMPFVNYRALVEDLKSHVASEGPGTEAARRACRRMMPMLDVDADTPLETLIDRLEAKWRAEGLISGNED
jgi:hypothetical protein